MIKRILTGVLAAAMLAGAAYMPGTAQDALSFDIDAASGLVLTDGVVRLAPGTNASELLSCFKNRDSVSLRNADGEALTFADTIPSGAVISCGDDSATVVVTGDVCADGRINARDVIGAMHAVLEQTDGLCVAAADTDHDGSVTTKDVIRLMRHLVGWPAELSAGRPAVADKEDDELEMSFLSSMLCVAKTDTCVNGTADGLIRMAKNELEDAQIVLTSSAEKKDLTLEVGDLENESGDVLEKEIRYAYYYDIVKFRDLNSDDTSNTVGGWWADPYPKLRGTFNIGAGESQSFFVKVTTTADTKAGYYSAPVCVKDAGGNEIKRATLRVYVWDFTLSETPACASLFNMSSSGIAGFFELYNGDAWPSIFRDEWYEFALKNKISPSHIPYDITSSEADRYMDDPRQTAFVSLEGRCADAFNSENIARTTDRLRATYDKLSQKQAWLDKAYIYTVDEPWGRSGADMIIAQWNGAKAILGDDMPFKTIVPFGNSYINEENRDLLDVLSDYCNAFCPGAGLFTEYATYAQKKEDPIRYPIWGDYMSPRQYEAYGNFEPRYNALRARGDSMWWYICVGPEYPYANFFNSYQGAWNRVVFWQQYRYNSDGFLYWETCMWLLGEHDSRRINLTRTNGGDGLLIYPGTFWGEGYVPVPTQRLEMVRDGIEDFQYLRQLEAVVGRDKALGDYSNRIAPSIVQFTKDYDDIESVRSEMGFMLESVSK